MLEIKTYQTEHGVNITIFNGKQEMNIFFGGNLDLYWSYHDDHQFNYKSINTSTIFEVTKENYYLYILFEKLYTDIEEGNISYEDELDDFFSNQVTKEKDIYKNRHSYNSLWNNGCITWISDEVPDESANSVEITKKGENFIITFSQKDNLNFHYTVRFSNSGSRYDPFNILFMEMYRKLKTYDSTYYQIHMEEYLYQKKLIKM